MSKVWVWSSKCRTPSTRSNILYFLTQRGKALIADHSDSCEMIYRIEIIETKPLHYTYWVEAPSPEIAYSKALRGDYVESVCIGESHAIEREVTSNPEESEPRRGSEHLFTDGSSKLGRERSARGRTA
jgi:hypothetical protein